MNDIFSSHFQYCRAHNKMPNGKLLVDTSALQNMFDFIVDFSKLYFQHGKKRKQETVQDTVMTFSTNVPCSLGHTIRWFRIQVGHGGSGSSDHKNVSCQNIKSWS